MIQKPRALILYVLAAAIMASTIALADPGGVVAEARSLTGKLLVATEKMGDPRFQRSVIFMLKHDDSGALGLVINRVLAEGSIASLLKMFGLESEDSGRKIRVLYGGPVEPQTGFVLHSTDYVSEGTQLVTDRVAVTTNLDIINAISAGQGPKLSLIALGYAGWGPGQLEREMDQKAWIHVPFEEALLFDKKYSTKWRRAMAKRGIDL